MTLRENAGEAVRAQCKPDLKQREGRKFRQSVISGSKAALARRSVGQSAARGVQGLPGKACLSISAIFSNWLPAAQWKAGLNADMAMDFRVQQLGPLVSEAPRRAHGTVATLKFESSPVTVLQE